MRCKQNTKTTTNLVGMLASLWQAFLAINAKRIQARFSPPTYVSCILRYTEDAEDTLTVLYCIYLYCTVSICTLCSCCLSASILLLQLFVRAVVTPRVTYKASWFNLVRLHFQHVRTTTAVVVDLALTVNTIAAVGKLQKTLV